jgi:hypothetical protein
MKLKFFLGLLIGIASAPVYAGDTYTTRLHLPKPALDSPNWGPKYWNALDIIDANSAAMGLANIFTTTNTFVSTTSFVGPVRFPGVTGGETIYFDNSGYVNFLGSGADGKVLTAHGTSAPTWETPSSGSAWNTYSSTGTPTGVNTVCSLTIPANHLKVGDTVRVTSYFTTGNTDQCVMRFGGTDVVTSGWFGGDDSLFVTTRITIDGSSAEHYWQDGDAGISTWDVNSFHYGTASEAIGSPIQIYMWGNPISGGSGCTVKGFLVEYP